MPKRNHVGFFGRKKNELADDEISVTQPGTALDRLISGVASWLIEPSHQSSDGSTSAVIENGEAAQLAPIEILPPELIARVANYLEPIDAMSLRTTTKFHQVVIDTTYRAFEKDRFVEQLKSLSQAPLNITKEEIEFGLSLKRIKEIFNEIAQAQWQEIQYINNHWRMSFLTSFWGNSTDEDRSKLHKVSGPAINLDELKDRNKWLDSIHYARIKGHIDKNREPTRLFLGATHLTRFPASILTDPALSGFWAALRTLGLGSNQLTAIPAEIGNLQALEWLKINSNKLTTIPAEIGNLSALQGLELAHNKLTSIPAEIGALQALQTLGLENNLLTAIPSEIGNLQALRWLRLTENKLASIPVEIGELKSLQQLFLGHNQLTVIPAEISNLQSLRDSGDQSQSINRYSGRNR